MTVFPRTSETAPPSRRPTVTWSNRRREGRRNQGDRLIGYALEDLDSLFVDQHGAPHAW